jgi:integrase/recombinase XerD
MARQVKKRKRREIVGNAADPDGFVVWLRRYLEWLRVQNYSEKTIEGRQVYLGLFVGWADTRGMAKPSEVSRATLETYQRHLFHRRKTNGKPLSARSQHTRLVAIRAWFRWLTRQNAIKSNPASELELPKLERRLPKAVLSVTEAERIMGQPDLADGLGLRDRAILETLYSSGIRRQELIGLSVWDLDHERGTIMVRQGKGKRDRMVPVGERAVLWIGRYLDRVRPGLVVPPDDGVLFLTSTGEPFSPRRLTQLVGGYVDGADLGKRGACHLFRHTMATLMLEGGADIRFIQEMLGHVLISTTQLYTQVSIRMLKQIHSATHPAARLDHVEVATPGGRTDGEQPTVDELLGDLDAEADEDDESSP